MTVDPTNGTAIPLSTVQMSAALLTAGSSAKLEDSRYCRDAARWVAVNLPAEGSSSGKMAYELLQRSLGICPYNSGDLADARRTG